jgi:hypothetical protein
MYLCLPSIVEGRALVMQGYESGIAYYYLQIRSGEDLIIGRETGFLVPIFEILKRYSS